jgi:hypothetical protein
LAAVLKEADGYPQDYLNRFGLTKVASSGWFDHWSMAVMHVIWHQQRKSRATCASQRKNSHRLRGAAIIQHRSLAGFDRSTNGDNILTISCGKSFVIAC